MEKHLDKFHLDKRGLFGRRADCKNCNNLHHQQWRSNHKQRINQLKDTYRANNPEKISAQKLLSRAIERGDIVRPLFCGMCGESCKPDGHHADYTKPLDITWLCRKCHRLVHKI